MTLYDIDRICIERLARWRHRLKGEHATPLLLLGAGHDHKEGQSVLCTLEDLPDWTDAKIAAYLRGVADHLDPPGKRG